MKSSIFPRDRIADLLKSCVNSNERMLFALMGGGAMRPQDVLHLLYVDVLRFRPHGETIVFFEDPVHSMVEVPGRSNPLDIKQHKRNNFIIGHNEPSRETSHTLYDLKPRCNYPVEHPLYVPNDWHDLKFYRVPQDNGFPGPEERRVRLFPPEIDQLFFEAFEMCWLEMDLVARENCKDHPWLISNQDGLPLTMNELQTVWRDRLTEIDLDPDEYDPLSLREACCHYIVSLDVKDIYKAVYLYMDPKDLIKYS